VPRAVRPADRDPGAGYELEWGEVVACLGKVGTSHWLTSTEEGVVPPSSTDRVIT
jgi:hypothetical protein